MIDHYFICRNKGEVWEAIEKIGEMRGSLPYEIDGAVVKLNRLSDRESVPIPAKNGVYGGVNILRRKRRVYCGKWSSPWGGREE